MSFTFKWPRFSDQFHTNAIQMLESALNKGNKPPVIADRIEVVELEMGTQVRIHATAPRQKTHTKSSDIFSLLSSRYEISESSPWISSVVSSG